MTQRHIRNSSPRHIGGQPVVLVMDHTVAGSLDERQRANRQRALHNGWVRLACLPVPEPRVANDLTEASHTDRLEAVVRRSCPSEDLLRHPLALAITHGAHALPRVRLLQYLGPRVEDGGDARDEGETWLGPEVRPEGEADEMVGWPDGLGFETLEAEVEVDRPGVVNYVSYSIEDPRVDWVAGEEAAIWVR